MDNHTKEKIKSIISILKDNNLKSYLINNPNKINEIVEELGFTDESHLNRLFKKYKDVSPTEFRKINKLL